MRQQLAWNLRVRGRGLLPGKLPGRVPAEGAGGGRSPSACRHAPGFDASAAGAARTETLSESRHQWDSSAAEPSTTKCISTQATSFAVFRRFPHRKKKVTSKAIGNIVSPTTYHRGATAFPNDFGEVLVMLSHQQRASFLFVASMLILACAGCQRGLQGRFVCTQQLSQQHLTGETSTVRPVLDFRRDGTVYLDGVLSGDAHLRATYSVQADQVRFTLLGGLVHTGTIRGDIIDTDFAQLQMVKVTKTAEGAGVYQPDQKALGMNYEFIAPGETYETFEPQLVKLSFKYAGGGGTSHGPLLPVAVIVLLLFVVLLVVILLPKLNLHLVGRGTRTYLHRQQTQQPPQPPSVPVLYPPAPPSQSVTVETPRPQAASAPAPPSPSQPQHGVLDVHIDPDEAADGAATPAPLQELAATPPPAPATPPTTSADDDDIDVRLWP